MIAWRLFKQLRAASPITLCDPVGGHAGRSGAPSADAARLAPFHIPAHVMALFGKYLCYAMLALCRSISSGAIAAY